MALQTTSYTRDELITAVRGDVGLRATNLVTDADIIRWSSEIVRMAAQQAPFYRVTDDVDTTANTMEYPLPADCIQLEAVAHNDLPLELIAYDDLLALDPYWRLTGSGTPYSWYARGNTAYGLYPAPDATVVDAVQLIYTAIPAMPSGGSSKFNFPIANERLIIAYCSFRASMKDATGEGGKRVDYYEKEYMREMNRLIQSVADVGYGGPLVMGGDATFMRRTWRDWLDRAVVPDPN